MPILGKELRAFVKVHNNHRIRADYTRLNHIHGRPNNLYRDRLIGKVHSFLSNQALLQQLQNKLIT
jgi:hypothetical protein